MSSMYAPPMMPVASTERVSRYTQNVSANQRKLVVTFAIIVFTSTWTNMRMPPGGGVTAGDGDAPVAVSGTSDPLNSSDTQARITAASDIRNPSPARRTPKTRRATDVPATRHP